MPSFYPRRLFCYSDPDACWQPNNTHMNKEIKVVARRCCGNANHHLWNNHGTWWCYIQFHLGDFTTHRLRLSLDTQDLNGARRLRDALLALFGSARQPSTQEVL